MANRIPIMVAVAVLIAGCGSTGSESTLTTGVTSTVLAREVASARLTAAVDRHAAIGEPINSGRWAEFRNATDGIAFALTSPDLKGGTAIVYEGEDLLERLAAGDIYRHWTVGREGLSNRAPYVGTDGNVYITMRVKHIDVVWRYVLENGAVARIGEGRPPVAMESRHAGLVQGWL